MHTIFDTIFLLKPAQIAELTEPRGRKKAVHKRSILVTLLYAAAVNDIFGRRYQRGT